MNSTDMNLRIAKVLVLLFGIWAGITTAAYSETIIIEAGYGGQNSNSITLNGVWTRYAASPVAAGTTSSANSYYMGATNATATITPLFSSPGGRYRMELARPACSYVIPGHGISIQQSGCSGLPAVSVAPSAGANLWNFVGELQLSPGVTQPTITIGWNPENGVPSSFALDRIFASCVRFVFSEAAPYRFGITSRNSGAITMEWTSGVLQSCERIANTNTPWVDVTAVSPHTVQLTNTARFFRTRGP